MYLGWVKHVLARRAFLWAFVLILISQPPLSASIVHINSKLYCVAGLLSRQMLSAQGILFRNIPCVLENALQFPRGSELTNGFGLQRWTTGNYLVASPRWNQNYGRASFHTKSLGWLWKRSKQVFKVIECICSILCSLPHFCPPLALQLRSQSTCRSGPRTAWRSASRAGPCTSSHWAPAGTQHHAQETPPRLLWAHPTPLLPLQSPWKPPS